MSRPVIPSDFEGKTVDHVNCSAVNCLTFLFKDGTVLTLEVEAINSAIGFYGLAVVELTPEPEPQT